MKLCITLSSLRAFLPAALITILFLPTLAFAQMPPVSAPPVAPPAVVTSPILSAPNDRNAQAPTVSAPTEVAPDSGIALKLPRDLSPWGMFLAADIVVKAVMIGLAFASLLTWTIWLAKVIELIAARRRIRATIAILSEARSLSDCIARLPKDDAAGALVRAAATELRLSADGLYPVGVKERIASRLERIEAAAGRRMIRGKGILATIGATAPFVGLFGTVWGIMN